MTDPALSDPAVAQAAGDLVKAADAAAPALVGLVAKRWPSSLTIMSAIVGVGGAAVSAYQAFKGGDMTAVAASVTTAWACVGAIVGRFKATVPVK